MAVAAGFVADESGFGWCGGSCGVPDDYIFTDAIIGRNIARNTPRGSGVFR